MPKDEKDTSVPPSSDTLFKNMDGDNRSADQIINDNPVLKNLGNQKDIKQEELKKQFGDWTANNPDEKAGRWRQKYVLLPQQRQGAG